MTRSTLSKTVNHFKSILFIALFLASQTFVNGQCGDLFIAGVIDGDLSGGQPKALQLCASGAIPDLSVYGFESVTNGNSSGGAPEFTIPNDALAAGDCIWIANDLPSFNTFFGFGACYEANAIAVNGDDPILLYCGGVVVDAFGSVGTDGTGECWEYMDGWAFNSNTVQNGGTFTCADYTFSLPNALDGETTNATAGNPYPNTSINCASQTCTISNVSIMSATCVGDNFDYEICATVANGSGDYSLIESGTANPDIAVASVPDGQVCFQVSISGPTMAGSLDLDVIDTNDPTCAGGTPVTLIISECPSTTTTADVYISELSYNPCSGQGPDGDCEYIIITNGGMAVADISNYTISNAFTYTFPAGTTIPVGGNLSLGISGDCAGLTPFDLSGGWTGSMTNTSETVELNDASGTNVFTITYNSSEGGNGNCDALCIDNAGMITECPSSLEGGGTCPDLSGAAPTPVIVNSTCAAGETVPSGGSISAPSPTCPTGSTLEYAVNGGAFSSSVPIYSDAGPAQVIVTRCICISDPAMISMTEGLVTTVPGTCSGPGCEAAISTFPANGN